MNRGLAIGVFALVAIMMVGSIMPVMADPPDKRGNHDDHPDDCLSGTAKGSEESGGFIPVRCLTRGEG